MDNVTIIVEEFNTLVLIVDRTSLQKINEEIDDLNKIINLLDVFGTFQTRRAEYTFFSITYGIFTMLQ